MSCRVTTAVCMTTGEPADASAEFHAVIAEKLNEQTAAASAAIGEVGASVLRRRLGKDSLVPTLALSLFTVNTQSDNYVASAARIAASGADRPVINSTWRAAWCTSSADPGTTWAPRAAAASASGVGHGA